MRVAEKPRSVRMVVLAMAREPRSIYIVDDACYGENADCDDLDSLNVACWTRPELGSHA